MRSADTYWNGHCWKRHGDTIEKPPEPMFPASEASGLIGKMKDGSNGVIVGAETSIPTEQEAPLLTEEQEREFDAERHARLAPQLGVAEVRELPDGSGTIVGVPLIIRPLSKEEKRERKHLQEKRDRALANPDNHKLLHGSPGCGDADCPVCRPQVKL